MQSRKVLHMLPFALHHKNVLKCNNKKPCENNEKAIDELFHRVYPNRK